MLLERYHTLNETGGEQNTRYEYNNIKIIYIFMYVCRNSIKLFLKYVHCTVNNSSKDKNRKDFFFNEVFQPMEREWWGKKKAEVKSLFIQFYMSVSIMLCSQF